MRRGGQGVELEDAREIASLDNAPIKHPGTRKGVGFRACVWRGRLSPEPKVAQPPNPSCVKFGTPGGGHKFCAENGLERGYRQP